mgnify:CR=1 FL=1
MAEYISEAEVLQRALDTYGSAMQIVVMMEEMSELQKELCKYLRGKYSPASIAEEIADVEIMLEQMKMLFCCADDVVNAVPKEDVAPVVHCKDCAHRTEMGNCGHPRHHGILPSAYPYDFCSYGERNEVT